MHREQARQRTATSEDQRLVTSLLDWYVDRRRDLPWRRSPDPYRVWLSEVMLQQTRVETVIPYFQRFLERFPRIEDLAAAREDDVLALWSGLGYYRRARSLREGARIVVERHGGEFPRDRHEALALPGVGPYTAAAILSIAYGIPHPVVDGNVERVVCRVFRIAQNSKSTSTRRRIDTILRDWIPDDRPSDFNQGMMELGATVCTPTTPRCADCPIKEHCAGHREGDASSYPRLPARRRSVPVELEVGVLRSGDRFLMERASGTSFLEGLWLFPLVEKTTESLGIADTLAEKLGVVVRAGETLESVRHSITYRRITLLPRVLEADTIDLHGKDEFRWAQLEELGEGLPVSSICLKIAALIRRTAD